VSRLLQRLLYGTSQRNLNYLQRVQNSLAPCGNSSPALFQFHLATATAALAASLPACQLQARDHYIPGHPHWYTDFPCVFVSSIGISHRRHCALALLPPCTGLMPPLDFYERLFAVSAPATWNNIPASICDSGTLTTFRTAFETHLFNSAYTSRHWRSSIGASDSLFRDVWCQLNKFMLVDWLIVTCSHISLKGFKTFSTICIYH